MNDNKKKQEEDSPALPPGMLRWKCGVRVEVEEGSKGPAIDYTTTVDALTWQPARLAGAVKLSQMAGVIVEPEAVQCVMIGQVEKLDAPKLPPTDTSSNGVPKKGKKRK